MITVSELLRVAITTNEGELARSIEDRQEVLFGRAASGDARAHDDLVALHAAYLACAYIKQAAPLPQGTDSARRHLF